MADAETSWQVSRERHDYYVERAGPSTVVGQRRSGQSAIADQLRKRVDGTQ